MSPTSLEQKLAELEKENKRLNALLQCKDQEHLHDHQLLLTANAVSAAADESIFSTLIDALGKAVGADWALIGTLMDDRADSIQTVAFWRKGKFQENTIYQLSESPCQQVMNSGVCSYACSVASLFPEDHMLTELGIEGYVGAPLRGASGETFGVIAVLMQAPIGNPSAVESLISIFATRAASEILRSRDHQERLRYIAQLEESQRQIEEQSLQLERALVLAEASAKAKSHFLANMSHEIRTPMNGVVGLTELLAETSLDDEQLDLVKTIQSSGDSLLGIINDILDFSKFESGEVGLECRSFKLSKLFSEIQSLFKAQLQQKELSFATQIASSIPEVIRTDERKVRQILVNLVGNAIKFTPKSGHVEMTVETQTPADGAVFLQFAVRDSGIGIPLEKQQEIFKAFAQVEGSLTRNYGGTGLGLAISRQLVCALGGELQVESTHGAGSTFSFAIPFSESDRVDAHDPSPTLIEGQNTALPKLAVLLVEDNPVNQQFMSTLLSKRGHVVTIANNGQEAVEVFREEEFDIILMDIQMPVMGGDEATRLIRKLEPNGSTPIIAVSAHALPEERERILRGGANAFVLKPIKVDQLLGVMASVLSVD